MTKEKDTAVRRPWPEGSASLLSKLTYAYIEPLLEKGASPGRVLNPEDLFDAPEEEKAADLSETFRHHTEQAPTNF